MVNGLSKWIEHDWQVHRIIKHLQMALSFGLEQNLIEELYEVKLKLPPPSLPYWYELVCL